MDTAPPYVLVFREGISIADRDGVSSVEAHGQSVPLRRLSPGLSEALRALSAGGASEEEMAAVAEAREGTASLPFLAFYLERFKALGFLSFSARSAGVLLATLVRRPSSPGPHTQVTPGAPDPAARYVLSRFACARRHEGHLVVESPLAAARVVLHDPRPLALFHALSAPRTAAELGEVCPEAPAVLGLLVACRAAVVSGSGDQPGDPAAMWSFHDLLFHAQSRFGRSSGPVGATYRFAGKAEPLPAVKPRMAGPRIALLRPAPRAMEGEGGEGESADLPLTRALEERCSIRTYGEPPIHAKQLGELLHRAARVRGLGTSSGEPRYPTSSRPYPGGGACYELEIYLAVRACEGLAQGLYHYDPEEHALTGLSGPTPAVDSLLSGARAAMLAPQPPQVLLVVAARFGRVMWKYESTAYALILKDVGALYQTMYLVATAMGLAACALGTGDADLFAAAAGLDYLTETSVGEMALGSRAP